jgi:hypothetical protein
MTPRGAFLPRRFATLGAAVAGVFAVSLGPFVWYNQIPQLLSRLFPFSRGLNHAYWAPNAWALLTALDRILILGAKKMDLSLSINPAGVSSASRGLVGDTIFGVIPEIKPIHTFAITIALQSASIKCRIHYSSLKASPGCPRQTVDKADVSLVSECSSTERIHLLSFRMACPRESNSFGPNAPQV